MEDILLEEWQRVTIEALVERKVRIAQQAQKKVDEINVTLKRYTEEWTDGHDGPFYFESRPDEELYLVQVEKEDDPADMAPAE